MAIYSNFNLFWSTHDAAACPTGWGWDGAVIVLFCFFLVGNVVQLIIY